MDSYCLDHWKLDRSGRWFVLRFLSYWVQFFSVRRQVNQMNYDVAVDVYAYYPNSSVFLFSTNIKQRIGYSSGGAGRLFTNRLHWYSKSGAHMLDYMADLFFSFLLNKQGRVLYQNQLIADIKPVLDIGSYVVIHPGANNMNKHWDHDSWVDVIHFLNDTNIVVVITGYGPSDQKLSQALVNDCPFVNLVDQLSCRVCVCYW